MDCGLAVAILFCSSLWLTVSIGRLLRDSGELYDDFGVVRPVVRERIVRQFWVLLGKLSVVMLVCYVYYRWALAVV